MAFIMSRERASASRDSGVPSGNCDVMRDAAEMMDDLLSVGATSAPTCQCGRASVAASSRSSSAARRGEPTPELSEVKDATPRSTGPPRRLTPFSAAPNAPAAPKEPAPKEPAPPPNEPKRLETEPTPAPASGFTHDDFTTSRAETAADRRDFTTGMRCTRSQYELLASRALRMARHCEERGEAGGRRRRRGSGRRAGERGERTRRTASGVLARTRTQRPTMIRMTPPTVQTAKIAVDSLKTSARLPPHPVFGGGGGGGAVAFVALNALAL